MDDIPPQVDRRIKKALKALRVPWRVVKKRDHVFVQIEDRPMICIASNASKPVDRQTMKTLHRIQKT